MTTATPIPAAGAAPSMTHPSDAASEAPPAQAHATAAARPTMRAQIAENPLLSFFGLLIVALLAAAVASPHVRIDDLNGRMDRLDGRMDRLEDRMDRLEDRVHRLEDRVHSLEVRMEARFDELDRKLTALIAHLNATSAVENALAGRLTGTSDDAVDRNDDDP